LFEESSIRGLHAFGLAQEQDTLLNAIKTFDMDNLLDHFNPLRPALAHARYSTSGDWRDHRNNQPIIIDKAALVFNGVIHMGTKAEMEAEYDVLMYTDNDGELFLMSDHPTKFIAEMRGSFAGAWIADGEMFVGRNLRRPLWWVRAYGAIWYASTKNIFQRASFPEPSKVPVGVWNVQQDF
jgi:glutamine phosphoribosylpyrophosphate amidotransferase